MNNFTHILFDFDGTLFNTAPGIFASMQHVCDYYKLPYGEKDFVKMIGPSLKESFTTIFHLPESDVPKAIEVYREYYSVKGMFECDPYDGVFELIQDLKNSGKKILIATSKPEAFTKQILERKNLLHYFDFVGGADLGEQNRSEKIQVLEYVIAENGLSDKLQNCLMIGDRHYDINGAHHVGMKAAGILWGFGNKKEFEECKADFIFQKPSELLTIIK